MANKNSPSSCNLCKLPAKDSCWLSSACSFKSKKKSDDQSSSSSHHCCCEGRGRKLQVIKPRSTANENKFKNWKKYIKDRKKISKKIMKKTGKEHCNLLLNSSNEYRRVALAKRILDYADRLNPDNLTKRRQQISTLKSPCPGMSPLHESLPTTEKTGKLHVEIVGVPRMILKEESLQKCCPKKQSWLNSKYLVERLYCMHDNIKQIVPFFPDFCELEVRGKNSLYDNKESSCTDFKDNECCCTPIEEKKCYPNATPIEVRPKIENVPLKENIRRTNISPMPKSMVQIHSGESITKESNTNVFTTKIYTKKSYNEQCKVCKNLPPPVKEEQSNLSLIDEKFNNCMQAIANVKNFLKDLNEDVDHDAKDFTQIIYHLYQKLDTYRRRRAKAHIFKFFGYIMSCPDT